VGGVNIKFFFSVSAIETLVPRNYPQHFNVRNALPRNCVMISFVGEIDFLAFFVLFRSDGATFHHILAFAYVHHNTEVV